MIIDDKMLMQLPEVLQQCVNHANQLRQYKNELDSVRATLLVNFGKGRKFDVGLEDLGQSTEYMLLTVLTKLIADFKK